MPAAVDPLQDLLRRVRRRMIAARAARAAVAGMYAFAGTIACVAALRITIGLPASAPVAASVALVAAGLVFAWWALRRLPDERHVAMHVDHVMNLHELLASAVCTAGDDRAASQSLRAMAADAASRISPLAVPAGAPSARAALAAALSVALVMTMSFFAFNHRRANDVPLAATSGRTSGPTPPAASRADASSAASLERPRQLPSTRAGTAAVADADQRPIDANVDTQLDPSQKRDAALDEAGAAAGRSDAAARADLRFSTPSARSDGPPSQGAPVNGAVGTDLGGQTSGAASPTPSGAIDRRKLAASAARLEAAGRETASAALARGAVPDHCRDIVRAYFDLDPTPAPAPARPGNP